MFEEVLDALDNLTDYINQEDIGNGLYTGRLNCARNLIIDIKSEFNARNNLALESRNKYYG